MTARPTGPQPSTRAPSPAAMPDRLTAWRPTAIGSVSAAWRASSPLGTSRRAAGRQQHPLAVAAREQVGCRRGPASPSTSSMTGTDVTIVPAAGPSVSGPTSSTSTGELVAHEDVAGEVERRHAPEIGVPSIRPPSSSIVAPCCTKWRSDPQMPHAFDLDEHLTRTGPGIGDVVADEHPPGRSTAARITPPPSPARKSSSAALTSAGFSCCTQCPAPSTSTVPRWSVEAARPSIAAGHHEDRVERAADEQRRAP